MRIFKNAWFERFSRKEGISDAALVEAIERAEKGLIDADLGGGVLKQRVARLGQGKSKGYRTIILFRQGDRAVFAFGFAKSTKANLRADELEAFREAAVHVLALSDNQLADLVGNGQFTEVNSDDKEV